MARELGAALTAGAADCDTVDGTALLPNVAPRGLRGWLWRRLGRGTSERVTVEGTLDGRGEIAPGIDAYAVPGHTPGSYCYVARRADSCFVGDLVIGHRSALSRSLAGANSDEAQYAEEMLSFVAHASDLGCPGHGHPRSNFAAALEVLAREPRQSWTVMNTPGRLRRLAVFFTYVMRKRR